MRVAVVQLTSTEAIDSNLDSAARLVKQAAEAGASFVALPENFGFMRKEGQGFPCAQGLDGPLVGFVRETARAHGIHLLGGTFPEAAGGDRVYNTSVLVDPGGELCAVYRKIHLFDVDLREAGGGRFQESISIAPGDAPSLAETSFGRVGLSVCYDLRFPELYRRYAEAEARFLTVPSAFAPETGRDHWEPLLRARAIENQAFVIAPAQVGQHSPDRRSYGRSLIVDPWGLVLASVGEAPGIAIADCDLELQDRVRASLPALRHRRL